MQNGEISGWSGHVVYFFFTIYFWCIADMTHSNATRHRRHSKGFNSPMASPCAEAMPMASPNLHNSWELGPKAPADDQTPPPPAGTARHLRRLVPHMSSRIAVSNRPIFERSCFASSLLALRSSCASVSAAWISAAGPASAIL